MTSPEGPDIACSFDGCPTTIPRRSNDDYARTKGWHIFRGALMLSDVIVEQALCPDHSGNIRQVRTPVQFEGEQTLF